MVRRAKSGLIAHSVIAGTTYKHSDHAASDARGTGAMDTMRTWSTVVTSAMRSVLVATKAHIVASIVSNMIDVIAKICAWV